MTVLVTGGAGFLGLNIVEAFLSRGDNVVVADKNPLPQRTRTMLNRLPGTFRVAEFDLADRGAAAELIKAFSPTRIVHGAALTPAGANEALRAGPAVEANVLGTVRLVEAAAGGVARLLLLSSASIYGANGNSALDLDEAKVMPAPQTVYSITKHAAEGLAMRLGRLHGLEVCVLRVGSAYGPWESSTETRDTPSALFQVTARARSGGSALLPREGWRDWVHAGDVAGACLALSDARSVPDMPVNIGLGSSFAVVQWCERLRQCYPNFRYRVADVGEASDIDYHGDIDRSPLSIARLISHTGFVPRFGLDEGFSSTMHWLEQNGRH